MSVTTMASVLAHSQSGGNDRLVLLAIASHDGPGGAWPSISTLAAKANCSETRVRTALRNLTRMGELQVSRNQGGDEHTRSDRRPNRYAVTVPCPATCDGTDQHRTRTSTSPTAPAAADSAPAARRRGPDEHEDTAAAIVAASWEPYSSLSAQNPAAVRSVVVYALRNGCNPDAVVKALAALARQGRTVAGWSLTAEMNPAAARAGKRRVINPDRVTYDPAEYPEEL